ncbi:MAG: TRAP transporter small permease [Pseudomonadota bacterium]
MRIIESINRIFYFCGAISICFLFLIMFGDVSGRFLFNSPIRGTAEVSEYLLVAIAFLSLGYAQLKGTHISVDTLVSHLPGRLRSLMDIVFSLLAMGFFTIMCIQTADRAYLDWQEGILLSATTVRLPVWWPSFVAAVGCLLLVVSLGVQVVRSAVKLGTGRETGVEGR